MGALRGATALMAAVAFLATPIAAQPPPLTNANIHAAVIACLTEDMMNLYGYSHVCAPIGADWDGVTGNCPGGEFGEIWTWDVSGVTNMNQLFAYAGAGCQTFSGASVANWDVSSVTNMNEMFRNTGVRNSSHFASWDVSNVVYFSYMFASTSNYPVTGSGLGGPSNLDGFSDWDMSSAQYIDNMFNGCFRLIQNVGATNWDLRSILHGVHGSNGPFHGVFKQTGLQDFSGFKHWPMAGHLNINSCECHARPNCTGRARATLTACLARSFRPVAHKLARLYSTL